MQFPLTPLLLLLLLVACLGCGPSRDSFCLDNQDCETHLTCFQNQCLLLRSVPDQLVWEVIPPSSDVSQTLVLPSKIQPLLLSTCRSIVRGDLGEGPEIRVDVEGQPDHLPGRCISDQKVLAGAFSLSLPPGTWRLTFHPPHRPPFSRTVQVPPCKTQELGALAPRESRHVAFLPTHGSGDPRPKCGIRVQAFDPHDGEPLSHPMELRLSPNFECLPPTPEGWELEIATPLEGKVAILVIESATPSSPTMRRLIHSVVLEGERTVVGAIPTASQAPERITLFAEDPNGHPVEGVVLSASWGEKERTCLGARLPLDVVDPPPFPPSLAHPTGTPGTYEIWLPPGQYDFRAVPPEATRLAAETTRMTVRGGNLLVLKLSAKSPVSGTVGSSHGPRPGARVLALPQEEGPRPFETVTDSRGAYELALDPGAYLLLADPVQVELPRVFRKIGEARGVENFNLPEPTVVAGVVRDQRDEEPMAGAVVRAWSLREGFPVVAGEALSDGSGRFVLRLSK